mgnify:CR=1 FL=1
MDTKPVFHGSDIEKICSYYGLKKEDIVKFGANVNPLGLSPKASAAIAAHVDIFSSYPDREYTTLRNTISEYCNIPADFILPGNGSSELISLLIQEKAPKHTLILGPTYSEYSRELSFSGSTQEYYHLQESNDFEPRRRPSAATVRNRDTIFSFSATLTIPPPLPSHRRISAS